MSESPIVKYIDGKPIKVESENKKGSKEGGVNGCVLGPPCPTCRYSHGSIHGCVAPNVYCSKQIHTPCPDGW